MLSLPTPYGPQVPFPLLSWGLQIQSFLFSHLVLLFCKALQPVFLTAFCEDTDFVSVVAVVAVVVVVAIVEDFIQLLVSQLKFLPSSMFLWNLSPLQ